MRPPAKKLKNLPQWAAWRQLGIKSMIAFNPENFILNKKK
jgi:hypothetical protein